MKIRDALYHAVHDCQGGVHELATRLGLADSTLQNIANPRIETHEWTLKRIKQVYDFTGDERIAHAFAAEFGGVFLPMPSAEVSGGSDLFRASAAVAKELGDIVAELQAAMTDERINQNERERIHQQIYELTRAAHQLGMLVDRSAQSALPPLSVVPKVK
jgi:hypothetical protein